jgi:transcriptional regulator with PAS, ATPase and Fis domain
MPATAINEFPSAAPVTVTEGLANIVQAFTSRGVNVTRATLKRPGSQIHELAVDDKSPADTQRFIEGRGDQTLLVVSFNSSLTPALNAELQAATTTAATAAQNWTEPVFRPTLVKNPAAKERMIGASPEMQELAADIRRAATSSHVVLIIGESGTGKTTAALMIHEQSPRAAQPFVDINCAALPETLIESELFGYEKGAFTGASVAKKGLFETADGGTLFLDEIGEMKPELQAKLLTAIEQKKIRRLGGVKDIQCDVRIIAASSRDLQQMVAEGKFREDLYYRLAVLEVPIAPLRERREDIALLVRDRLVYEQELAGYEQPFEIDDAAIDELAAYEWPGNIRQLHNIISRLASRTEQGNNITAVAARKELARFQPKADLATNSHRPFSIEKSVLLPANCRLLLPGESLRSFMNRVRRDLIEATRDSTGNMTNAAKRLQCDRSAISKLLLILKNNESPSDGALAA